MTGTDPLPLKIELDRVDDPDTRYHEGGRFDPRLAADGSIEAINARGLVFGTARARTKIASLLRNGQVSLFGEVTVVGESAIRGEVVLGAPGERYVPRTIERRIYSVGLVGESRYQDAILRCSPGDTIRLEREPTNRHDPDAVMALNRDGDTIGYLARDCWLKRAMIEEGKEPEASILDIPGGLDNSVGLRRTRPLGVVLEVWLGAMTQATAERIE